MLRKLKLGDSFPCHIHPHDLVINMTFAVFAGVVILEFSRLLILTELCSEKFLKLLS
jgi:hypothetical protein